MAAAAADDDVVGCVTIGWTVVDDCRTVFSE